MSGDVGAEVAAVLAAHVYAGWGACSCGWKRDNLDSPRHREHQAERLAPLIAERVEAAKAEALRPFEELFGGGPDTPCRTVWRRTDPTGYGDTIECVEVPMDDLRAAFDRDPEATP